MNHPGVYGKLTAEVKEISMQKIKIDTIKNDDGSVESMKIYIHPRAVYSKLLDQRSCSEHKGYRHVYLFDDNKLGFNEGNMYFSLGLAMEN